VFDLIETGCYKNLIPPVGPWRSWKRASMASRRSGVQIPSAPPNLLMAFYVYILQSEATGHYYVGQTKDLAERVPIIVQTILKR
jgi:hypothetical protein